VILQSIPGAPGVLAVELAGLDGRLALVRDPAQPYAVLSLHAESKTVGMRLDLTTLRVLMLACREGSVEPEARRTDNAAMLPSMAACPQQPAGPTPPPPPSGPS
jgi:hypothetical protein